MRALALCSALWLLCGAAAAGAIPLFTDSRIAWANLDAQIARGGDSVAVDGLWLLRLRLRADGAALERVAALVVAAADSANGYLRRARHRAVLHQFALALDDLEHAARAGAAGPDVRTARAMLLVANGHAREVLAALRKQADAQPGVAGATALAHACVAVGLPRLADRWYRRALRSLDTVSPFAWAELQFARGVLWSEHLGNPVRGAQHYRAALTAVPEYVGARIHLAEIEQAGGRPARALALVESIAPDAVDPEASALRAVLRRTLSWPGAASELSVAHLGFATLTARFPLAYADHAARFYLGLGKDPQSAWTLARLNLTNRPTAVAQALAAEAARAAGIGFVSATAPVPSSAERAACTPLPPLIHRAPLPR